MGDYRRFIRTVRQAMAQKGLSARALARQVRISASYVTRVLAGERTPPTNAVIERMARALDLNADRLLMEAGRLPVFLRATRPLTDQDLDALRQSYERIRQHHTESRGRRAK